MFTSVIGASLACQNVATRMWCRMGQSGVLPKAAGTVPPVRKTPTVAIHVQFALSILRGLVLAGIFGPTRSSS
jgi:amino acid transporter